MAHPQRSQTKSGPKKLPQLVAALDLGSNSFHLLVCRPTPDGPQVVERLRDQVQLRAGLKDDGYLSDEAIERAEASARRFAQWLRPRPELQARVVATNTFRTAKNGPDLQRRIEDELGRALEIISPEEEARLIHLGVSHAMPTHKHPALIFDIGGGSTECILGEGEAMVDWRSFEMGCVSWSQRFFPEGVVTRAAYAGASAAADAIFHPLAVSWRDRTFDARTIGTSGTVRSAERVLRASGDTAHGVTLEGLQRLIKAVLKAGRCDAANLPGLKRTRTGVFFGGIVILEAILRAFGVGRLEVSHGALREGIVHELCQTPSSEDSRQRAIDAMATRYFVDREQARRVRELTLSLFDQTAATLRIDDPEYRELLVEAALLHEIGLAISPRHHHLHAAYLIANTELAGSSTRDRAMVAAIVGGQRGRLDQAPFRRIEGLALGEGSLVHESLAPFIGGLLDAQSNELDSALKLAILLRLAVNLCRDRREDMPDSVRLSVKGQRLELELPRAYWDARPLTEEEFRLETAALAAVGYQLQIALH